MDGKTRKLILVGIGIIALITLASICSDVFLVIACMSVLTNLLVFAELGHKFWGELWDDDSVEAKVENTNEAPESMSDVDIDNKVAAVISDLDAPEQPEAVISDTASDTYIPSRNVGHIGYYEDPLLEPLELFPKYYGDVDNATVAFEKRRIRDQQSIDGRVNKGVNHFKCMYRSEFSDSERRDWFGNSDI